MPTRRQIDHFHLHARALEQDDNESPATRRQGKLIADALASAIVNGQSVVGFLQLRIPPATDSGIASAISEMITEGTNHPLRLIVKLEDK